MPNAQENQQDNEFKIKFDGQLHQVDANTLINSLVNISTILEEVNTELHPDEKTKVKIKALSQGSFLVHLFIEGQKLAQSMISPTGIATTASLVTIVTGLFAVKKHLLGTKPKETKEIEGNNVEITNEKGNVLVVESLTLNLYQHNQPIQDAISNNFETLENDSSVDAFGITDTNEHVLFNATRDEFNEMAIKSVAVDEDKKTIIESATVHIFKIVFQDNYKWEFYYKGNKISANITDTEFFAKIDKGERFAKGDTLIAELQINQLFDPAVNTWVNHSYQINKVIKHIPRDEQQKFSFENKDDEKNN